MRDAALPVIMIMLGLAWLLNSLNWLPDIHWLWIVGLCGAGVAILVLDGFTKSSVVAGPLLIVAGVLSFLRQHYRLGWHFIIPVMLIASGVLLLIARSPAIPESRKLQRHYRGGGRDGEAP